MIVNEGKAATHKLHMIGLNEHGDIMIFEESWSDHPNIFRKAASALNQLRKKFQIDDPEALQKTFERGTTNYFTLEQASNPDSPVFKVFGKNAHLLSARTLAYLNKEQEYPADRQNTSAVNSALWQSANQFPQANCM